MRRAISILFLSLSLLAQTEFHQLLKIPVLIQHFIEHCEKDANTSLIAFLKEHYSAFDERDADYDRDMELPFKSSDCVNGVNIIYCAPLWEGISTENLSADLRSVEYPRVPSYSYPQSFSGNIWQPPRT
jgi:hypothetical protein